MGEVVRLFSAKRTAEGPLYGGVDAGGTKFLCAVGSSPDDVIDVVSIRTDSQEATLGALVDFFERHKDLAGIGISCFGPLIRDDPDSSDYGKLRNSPKPGWENANIVGFVRDRFTQKVPIKIDTDVNGAAWAEQVWGAAQQCTSLAYVTVGTGVGVGVRTNGGFVTGVSHIELGHYRPPRHCKDPPWSFAGSCPYHEDCLEGLISGSALERRFGVDPATLDDNAPIWPIVADYLGHLCNLLILGYAPERIVLGGGVMNRERLIEDVRKATNEKLAGYLTHPLHASDLSKVIVKAYSRQVRAGIPPINAGVLGGFLLAGATPS